MNTIGALMMPQVTPRRRAVTAPAPNTPRARQAAPVAAKREISWAELVVNAILAGGSTLGEFLFADGAKRVVSGGTRAVEKTGKAAKPAQRKTSADDVDVTNVGSVNSFVWQAYKQALGRTPDGGELRFYREQLMFGATTPRAFAQELADLAGQFGEQR